MKKIVLRTLAAAAVLCVLVLGLVGNYLVEYAIGRSGDGGDREVALEVEKSEEVKSAADETWRIQHELNLAFMEEHEPVEETIMSEDGLALKGYHYENGDSHRWVLALHGYRGSHYGMMSFVQHYYAAGYQVFTPDLRACGASEGKYVGMGYPDQKDILLWLERIIEKDPQAEIVVHGISMGAAATMFTSGNETPRQVKLFIEDCGYTSVWDIFASELQLRFHLPAFPIMNVADLVARVKAGYAFGEASCIEAVSHCEKPMLFIHGTADDFIPYAMLDQVYNAKPGIKEKISFEGANHGQSMFADSERYWNSVFAFIDKYIQ